MCGGMGRGWLEVGEGGTDGDGSGGGGVKIFSCCVGY